MELYIDKSEVITRWYKHPKAGWVYINPTTNEELLKRWISIEGHLSSDLFPFWVPVSIRRPHQITLSVGMFIIRQCSQHLFQQTFVS